MTKKILTTIFCLAFALNLAAQTSGATGDCTWTLTGSGSNLTLTITGTGDMPNYSWNGSPWYSQSANIKTVVINSGVTSIGSYAFKDCYGLISVTIPNSVTSIGSSAFYDCYGLTSVTIPNSVTSIGSYAFYDCRGLTSVTIPNSVTSIGSSAFYDCRGLTGISVASDNPNYSSYNNVLFNKNRTTLIQFPAGRTGIYNIPASVTSIGSNAFSFCYGLTSVTIPNSVTSIGSSAFSYCSGLTSVTIPNSVTSIGNHAFYSTGWYNNQPSGVLYLDNWLIGYNGSMSANTNISILANTRGIADYAFEDCIGLTSITIPNSVTSIGGYAFSGCSGLTSVTIPNSVTSIGYGAFINCSGLTSVTIPNSVTSIGSSAFYNCIGLTSVTIPNSVTSIGNAAFYSCISLKELTIEDGSNTLDVDNGNNNFYDCPLETVYLGRNISYTYSGSIFYSKTTIKELTIGNSVTSIGGYAFSGCSGLTSVTIPNSVTSIGGSAFSGCSGLTSVTIPNSVTSIGGPAFSGCSGLKELTIEDGSDTLDFTSSYSVFGNCPLETVYLGRNISYKENCGNCSPFDSQTTIKEVVIGNSVTSIGGYAFSGCSGLTDVTVNWETPLSVYSYIFNGVTLSNANLHVPDNSCALYAAASVWKDFKFECTQTIDFSEIPEKTYGDAAITLSEKTNANLIISYQSSNTDVATVAGNKLTIKGAGTADITATQNDTQTHFTAATPVMQTLTVGKAPLTVKVDNKSRRINTPNPELTCSISGFKNSETQSVIDVLPTITTTATQSSGAGTYPITASGASDNNYSFTYQNGTLTVNDLQMQTITFNTLPAKTYGDAGFTLSASSSSGLPVTFESNNTAVATVSGNTVTLVGAGEASITASQAGNTDYSTTTVSRTLTVGKAALTVTADNKSRKIGEANPTLTYSISGFKNSETQSVIDVLPTITTTATQTSGAGNYPITVSDASDNNYSFTYQNGTLTVAEEAVWQIGYPNAADVIATLNLTSGTFTISGTGAMQNFNGSDNYAPWYAYRSSIKTAGIANGVTNIGDYAFYYCSGLTSVSIPNSVISIGNYAFYNCSGLTSVSIPNSVTSVGNYAFSGCSGLTSVTIPNSVISIGNSVFSNCSGLTSITIDNSYIYIGYYAFEYCSGLTDVTVNDATPLLIYDSVFSGINLSNVNLHVPQNSCAWYATASVWKDFKFACSQTIDFSTIPAKTYGDAAITLPEKTDANLTVSYQSSNTAVATVSGNTLTITGAGTADITATQSGATAHFTVTPVTQTLTVAKAPLTVTAENKTREYGAANPAFTLLYSGFKNAENESVLDVPPAISCAATATSPAGSYDIVLSGGSDNNYQYTLVNGVLQVINTTVSVTGVSLNKTAITLTIAREQPVAATEQLTATVAPADATNKNVTWTSTDNRVATVAGGLVTAVSAGTCSIIVTTQDGNFMAFCNVTVTEPTSNAEISTVQLSVYPNPVQKELFIKSDLQIKKVEIHSLSGTLLLLENNVNEKISVSALPGGIHILKVYTEKGVAVQKIVKKQ